MKGRAVGLPGVGDDDVEGARVLEEPDHRRLVADIARQGADRGVLACHPVQRIRPAATDHHLGPGAGKAKGKVGARARTATRHQNPFAGMGHARITSVVRAKSRRA